MAHFAQIDENNIVTRVLVIDQETVNTGLFGDPSTLFKLVIIPMVVNTNWVAVLYAKIMLGLDIHTINNVMLSMHHNLFQVGH